MDKLTWKIYWICTIIGTIVLSVFHYTYGIGFLAGSIVSAIILKFTDVSWSAYLTHQSLNKGTIFLNFLGKYATMALFLLACAKLPNILNIFAGAAGLVLSKPVIIYKELIRKEGDVTSENSK